METVSSFQPLAALASPLVCSAAILLSRRHPNIREGVSLSASVLLFCLILGMVPAVLEGRQVFSHSILIAPGLVFGFKADAFGLIFALTASFLWILVSIYSIGYMRALNEHAQTRFYFCFALAVGCAVGIALARNLVTFYLFYEALTFSTYWLVAHHEDADAFAGAKKYLAYLLLSGWFLFAAVAMTFALAGTTEFTPGGIIPPSAAPGPSLILLFALFAFGSMKAAWMPFHAWLPAAMVAPTPVSSLLHAVAVVKAGVFGVVRIVCHVFGLGLMEALSLGTVLGIFAAFTMLAGSFFAIGEDNLKRRLAFSTISQLSYILFGAALLTPHGIRGAMLHIPFHGFMKITLFLCAGAVMVMTGKKQISQLSGMGKQMPLTFAAFTLGAAGMCGIPPVAGFISKWFLCLGSLQAESLIFLGVILVSSVLDVIYFFPIIAAAFFKPLPGRGGQEALDRLKDEIPGDKTALALETRNIHHLLMVTPLLITGAGSVVLCLFPNTFHLLDLAALAVENLFYLP